MSAVKGIDLGRRGPLTLRPTPQPGGNSSDGPRRLDLFQASRSRQVPRKSPSSVKLPGSKAISTVRPSAFDPVLPEARQAGDELRLAAPSRPDAREPICFTLKVLAKSMNVLIVYAHPEPKSFNGAMKELAVEVLKGAGHTVQVSDLYAMNFAPAGGPIDFLEREDEACFRYQREQVHANDAGLFAPELREEMDKLVWADLVIFQFPLWWFSLPAILKGWVDRVFAMGFSYGAGQRYATGVFRGKRGMLAMTTGGPPASYVEGGSHGEIGQLLMHIQHGMFAFVGMDVVPPFIAYGAARVSPEERAAYLEAYRDRLLALESTAPIEFEVAARSA